MIPHLNSLLDMNSRGEMPIDEIVSYVVKVVALQGRKSDYADLPKELREEVAKKLAWYRQSGGWFVVSNTGTENYGAYVDKFLEKVGEL
jgi:hypothetical protein